MQIGAGKRDRRITVKASPASAPAAALDDFGQPVSAATGADTWTDRGSFWAAFMPVRDGEAWGAGQVEFRQAARFTVQYCAAAAAIEARDRLILDGLAWSIVGVKEIGRRRLIEITAEKTDAAAR